jgi:hypothetical protein
MHINGKFAIGSKHGLTAALTVTAGTKQWNDAQRSMIPMSYRI